MIINNKNVKLYFTLILILLLLLFFLYLTKCYIKRENFEENNTSQTNTISKNINNIEVPADFLPTHPWTNKKSGLDMADNPQEHYLYEDDEKIEIYNKDSSQFTRTFTCRPSITGVFTDCGPYSFNACGPIKPSTSDYDKSKNKKHRKHRNDKNKGEEISINCHRNICHHVYHHKNKWINHNHENNKNKNKNKNSRNLDQLDYDEYMNYRVAAVEAIKQLDREVNEPDKPFSPADMIPDENLVSKLLEQTYKYYRQFTGQDLKP